MSPDKRHPLVELAAQAIDTYVRTGKQMAPPSPLPAELQHRAGAFVSLHAAGSLRGCIGTIEPSQPNLALEVIHNAILAASEDPRFPPLTAAELARLEISVDVLSPPEPISSPDQLDPKVYGVIVQSGFRRGLLLPDLEGVDTVECQLDIARRKAGIHPSERVQLYRFRVHRHH
jgi:AmmeMemoRadiSam system protein A